MTKPAAEVVSDLGKFLFTKQWYENPNDPFKRSPSVMSYDRAKNRIVDQDARVWIAGLGDEGGSGSWLAAGMKLFGQPTKKKSHSTTVRDGVSGAASSTARGRASTACSKSLLLLRPEG